MSSVNTGVSMKVSFIGKGYAIDVYKSMAYVVIIRSKEGGGDGWA